MLKKVLVCSNEYMSSSKRPQIRRPAISHYRFLYVIATLGIAFVSMALYFRI
jgi:hypothetical protein